MLAHSRHYAWLWNAPHRFPPKFRRDYAVILMLIQQSGTSLQRVIAGPIKIQSHRLQPTGGWSCAIRPSGLRAASLPPFRRALAREGNLLHCSRLADERMRAHYGFAGTGFAPQSRPRPALSRAHWLRSAPGHGTYLRRDGGFSLAIELPDIVA